MTSEHFHDCIDEVDQNDQETGKQKRAAPLDFNFTSTQTNGKFDFGKVKKVSWLACNFALTFHTYAIFFFRTSVEL